MRFAALCIVVAILAVAKYHETVIRLKLANYALAKAEASNDPYAVAEWAAFASDCLGD
jgi:hypothetical protein